MMGAVPYFAYNLHMDQNQLRQKDINVRLKYPVVLPNYQLVFNVLEDEFFRFENRGLANIIPNKGDTVEGIMYEVRELDLHKLDEMAGVGTLQYYRKYVLVNLPEGDCCEAVSYAAWPDKTAKGLLPTNRYLEKMISAASQHGFSSEFRRWLKQHPRVS